MIVHRSIIEIMADFQFDIYETFATKIFADCKDIIPTNSFNGYTTENSKQIHFLSICT